MILDRTVQPPIKTITNIPIPLPKEIKLSNGIPVYVTNIGTQAVMKMQVVIRAGRPFEHKQMVSRMTARMLKEGTASFTSAQIAEMIDFYGATISLPTSLDYSSLVYYSMTKHFPQLIGLVQELLTSPVFPEKEIQSFKENSLGRLKIDLTKNDVVAYRKVTELIFGETHPYGYNSSIESYNNVNQEDLIQHFKTNFHADNYTIFLSGKIDDGIIRLLDQHLGQLPRGTKTYPVFPPMPPTKPTKAQFFIPDSVQKAIRIGKEVMTRSHEDYGGFTVLNTILGGYFGSRLMNNVREDKGYTYNIYSVQDTMQKNACFYVSTEIGNEFVQSALKEIYLEMERLQNDLVPDDELEMVKNYILGNMLNMVDGPFRITDVVKTLVLEERPYTDFQKMVTLVHTISAQELRDLAQKYFDPASMWEVIV